MSRLTRAQKAAIARKPRGSDELPVRRPPSYEHWLIRYALHLATEHAHKDQTDVVDLTEVQWLMNEDGYLDHYATDDDVKWLFIQVWMFGPFERRPSDLAMVLSPKAIGRVCTHPDQPPS